MSRLPENQQLMRYQDTTFEVLNLIYVTLDPAACRIANKENLNLQLIASGVR